MRFTHTYDGHPALPVWCDTHGERPLLIVVDIHGLRTSLFISPEDVKFSLTERKTPKNRKKF